MLGPMGLYWWHPRHPGRVEGGRAWGRGRARRTAFRSPHAVTQAQVSSWGSAHFRETPEAKVSISSIPQRDSLPGNNHSGEFSSCALRQSKRNYMTHSFRRRVPGWANWGSERFSNFPVVTELAERAGVPAQVDLLNDPPMGHEDKSYRGEP